MKKLIAVIAIVWGVAVIYRGLDAGLPSSPQGGRAWGELAAFGFAVAMVLLGVRHLWRVTTDADPAIGAGTFVLILAIAAAATAGAMKWKGTARAGDLPASISCEAVLDHMRTLIAARDLDGRAVAQFDARRPGLLARCDSAKDVRQNTCMMSAQTVDELARCAP
ncbi:MAG: hypothetical protein K8M05_04165 [Deltaproteobacteria bacterium]|nr:hypothetical protein [Kofleriaceae bacterium]